MVINKFTYKGGEDVRRSERGELTTLEEQFCKEYIKDLNATKAYLRTYELIDNTITYSSANSASGRLLNKAHIRDRIDELLDERRTANHDVFDRIVNDLTSQAFYDVNDYLNLEGGLLHVRNIEDVPIELRPAIKSIKETKHGIEIVFHDRQKAQEMLARLLGFWEENIRLQAGDGVNINIDIPRPSESEG